MTIVQEPGRTREGEMSPLRSPHSLRGASDFSHRTAGAGKKSPPMTSGRNTEVTDVLQLHTLNHSPVRVLPVRIAEDMAKGVAVESHGWAPRY